MMTLSSNNRMPTTNDRKILSAIETFGVLSIKQIGYMFFPKNEHNYYYARKRMAKLSKAGYVDSYEDKNNGKKYYCITEDKKFKLSTHREVLMDFYACLIFYGCKILDYKFEYKWINGKHFSDGVFFIEFNGIKRILIVEIDMSHRTSLKKLETIYSSGEAQSKFKTFPPVFIINANGNNYNYDYNILELKDYINFLDMKMNRFIDIVIPKIS